MYIYSHKLVVILKMPQRYYQKPTQMSGNCKGKPCSAGLETKVVNCGISVPCCSRAVSSPEMCTTRVLQKESEAHSFEVHKLLQCCFNTINQRGSQTLILTHLLNIFVSQQNLQLRLPVVQF